MKEYEYKCLECNEHVSLPAKNDPPEECVFCGGNMARVFGTKHVIYKGYDFVGPTYHEKRDR